LSAPLDLVLAPSFVREAESETEEIRRMAGLETENGSHAGEPSPVNVVFWNTRFDL
jgi:hypothetical protein